MDKGLEHDVEQVEDQREEDVDHVGSVDETGLEPMDKLITRLLLTSKFG